MVENRGTGSLLKRFARSPLLVQTAAVVVVVGALVLLLERALQLLPPSSLTLAAGAPGSGYHAIATRYRDILAEDGIEVFILDSAGSVENAALLAAGRADVALLQGGVAVPDGAAVEALAAVFLEPIFVFHRGDVADAADPAQWRGLEVAAGPPGSGTRAVVEAAVEALALPLADDTLQPLGGADAAAALLGGEVDVAVFVAPVEAPYLRPLLHDPTIRIASIRDGEALSRRLAFVREVDIPPAAIDYVARIPAERVSLLATVATLAARADLHPAFVDRLVRAAERIHQGPTLVDAAARFPNTAGLALPLNAQAAAAMRHGPSPLEGVVPYWVTAQVTRIALLLLPILVLLLPLLRAVPAVYAWHMHSRVYRRYNELIAIDQEAESGTSPERRRALLDRLDVIDREARTVRVPARFREYAYTLRLHVDLVRRKLDQTAALAPTSPRAPTPPP